MPMIPSKMSQSPWSNHGYTPPETVDVIDDQDGFTARVKKTHNGEQTAWYPATVLKKGSLGRLVSHDPYSSYQDNPNCTRALYMVAGFKHPVLVWFDNKTGKRVG